jgi:hypothetical protein
VIAKNHSTYWKSFISNHQARRGSMVGQQHCNSTSSICCNKDRDGTHGDSMRGRPKHLPYPTLSDTMQLTLVHHISKVPKNALLADDVDKFVCLLGWDQSAMAIKINPNVFFAATHDGEDKTIGARENKSIVECKK